ncbi:hypothetical protein KAR91_54275 [Candidatus Pacearchaeota archaeon]|nr:hypothetical protein [Candidatus Pacearchaeota archaeon]
MKKLFLVLLAVLLVLPVGAYAAGDVTQGTVIDVGEVRLNSHPTRTITFLCVGDSGDGSIPNTDLTVANFEKVKGWYLYEVEAYPTSGGPAPDAADVFILDENTIDLLESEDGGTTAYAGLTLIHATLGRVAKPNMYLPRAGLHVNYYPIIKNTITLKVANQGTVSADWTIVMTFVR